VKTYLKKEFDGASGNAFAKGKNTFLEQVVNAYYQMNSTEKAKLASVREELRAVYGEKPGFFKSFFTKADDRYKGAQLFIDQIK
jgi:hypothetical protein